MDGIVWPSIPNRVQGRCKQCDWTSTIGESYSAIVRELDAHEDLTAHEIKVRMIYTWPSE